METTIDVSTCGLRSEPDGAPSGSNMSATGTYAATSFPKGSSDRRNPEPNSKEVEQQNNENGSQPFNLSIGHTIHEQKTRPGEFVMRVLFSEFTTAAEKKIELVMSEPMERSLSKSLQRGEDLGFDQLLTALGSVAEHCLPSILRTLFSWYDRQAVTWLGTPLSSGSVSSATGSSMSSGIESMEKETVVTLDPQVAERRDMAVEFILCLIFIEVLKQLPFHPGHHDLVGKIEDLCFAHFKYREGTCMNAANGLVIADLYAEVLGVLAQARFASVRIRFLSELAELRGKEANSLVTQSIISLLMGMKFFRIKMAPIEDFEASFQFLTECAKYFLEVKQRDIKHALAGLFVEILVPVAATVKHEVNVPCLKSFVEMLYAPTLDMCTRSKHRLAIFPLVTCLLCVSQKPFFLHNWHYFLAMCLSQLKSREPKMSRVALESLYRLLWAYMIRIKCESNSATQSRLLSVVNSLFPKGSKGVVPRDTPLNIFVKIIQFIAQERLDFAMREIVFELLSVGRPIKIILTPERMNIGLRAFLVAADSLQQKDGDPPMPRSANIMPSGNTLLRVKKTFLNKVLTEDAARSIGMASYYPLIRKVFTDILRALDLQCGRPLLLTTVKEQEESLLTGDRKAKIDLFRTCVAAIPRLIPDGMSRTELLSLLARLTLHIDEELRGLAFQSLQSLLLDFPDWRIDVLTEFLAFASKEVPDTAHQQLDNSLRMLVQLLTSWRNAVSTGAGSSSTVVASLVNSKTKKASGDSHPSTTMANSATCYQAEGLALLMLCSVRSSTRRIGCHILKEVKALSEVIGLTEAPVIDVLDRICPLACEKVSNILPLGEKQAILAAISSNTLDLQWITDRSCPAWYIQEDETVNNPPTQSSSSLSILQSAVSNNALIPTAEVSISNDPWALCLKEFLDYQNVPTQCPRAVLEAWSVIMPKINAVYSYLEPSPVQDNRASLLRSATAPRKPPIDKNLYFKLWRNYLLFAFRTVPPNIGTSLRCISPDMAISSSPEAPDGRDGKSPLPLTSAMLFSVTPSSLYKLVVPLIRVETIDVRDLAVHSLGQINHMAVKDLFEELASYLKEASDRKQENVRRRKRKDNLRLQLLRVFEMIAREKTFGKINSNLINSYTPSSQGHHLGDSGSVLPIPLQEFFETCKGWLETETDRDGGFEMRLNFCKGLHSLLDSFDLDLKENLLKREAKKQLFQLCINWAGSYASSLGKEMTTSSLNSTGNTVIINYPGTSGTQQAELELFALQAAARLLTCGPVFQQSLLAEESQLYSWLDYLLSSHDSRVSELGEQVIIMLLEFNPDVGSMLDWVVSRCFTGTSQIADACFRAMATLFSAREYPCDRYVAIINCALLYSGSPKLQLQQTAFRLLQVLDRRFFGGLPPLQLHLGSEVAKDDTPHTLDALLNRSSYAKSQTFLSKQLSFLHPDLTMPIFSEISWRMKSARSDVRQSLLRYLQPWLHNMELVEPAIPSPNTIAPLSCFELDICSENLRESVSSSSSCSLCGKRNVEEGERLVRRGWGSTEATEMVLNNLLYLTAKFGDEHEREIEECWQTLCCSSPNNQRVVLYYLLIVTGIAPYEILPHAKRVLIYLFRARPVRLLEDLIAELQTVESLSWLVEKTETPPFYRLSHLRKTSSYSDTNVAPQNNGGLMQGTTMNHNPTVGNNSQFPRVQASELEKGTIHTKRRSAEESGVFQQPPHLRSSSSGAAGLFRSEKTRTISGPAALPDCQFLSSEKEKLRSALYETDHVGGCQEDVQQDRIMENRRYPSSETIAPEGGATLGPNSGGQGFPCSRSDEGMDHMEQHLKLLPLPMPEYGGYYAPLKEFLPPQQVCPFHRCNLAMMFITELINEGTTISVSTEDSKKEKKIDWCSQYLPLMIHMSFLGLDHLRPLVNLHSYNMLINLLTVSGAHKNHLAIAKLSLNQQTKEIKLGLTFPYLSLKTYDFLDPKAEFATSAISSKLPTVETLGVSSPIIQSPSHSPKSSPRTPSKRPHTPINLLLVIPEPPEYGTRRSLTIQEKTLALIKFFTEKRGQTLWNCEDITARVWNIRSANQLIALVQNSIDVISNSFPNSSIDRKWAQVSLQIGLACSSRHYAGRSLQVFRALKVPLVSRILCDILSRLVETVAETGDDMQGYVTELILTLEACVEAIPVDSGSSMNSSSDTTTPATEDNSKVSKDMFSPSQIRPRSGTETFGHECKRTELGRSRSVQSLSGLNDGILDENMERTLQQDNDVIPQIFWLALSLLESDFEYEYLLALRLLEKIMDRLPLERLECRDKVDRVQAQLQWNNFGGIVPLILKGCSNANTFEQSLTLLLRFIPFLDVNFVDPTGESGFPLSVIALLPLLLLHYDDPTPLCVKAAQLIAGVGACKGDSGAQALQHLSTVMTLYSRRSFSKESMQWTKCVIKYLYDSYSHLAPLLLGFLLDVLEKGPASVQPSILTAINCSFNYVDLTSMNTVSTELLRAIEKHLDGPYWRESLKILKLVVTRSSSLVAPGPPNYTGSSGPSSMISAWDSVSTTSSVAFTTESEFSFKKELPGRTMEFTFDVSQTPIIGRKHINPTNSMMRDSEHVNGRLTLLNAQGNLAQRSGSVGEMGISGGVVIQSNWKRPWQCQSRLRECLVSVLNACGQRVGLPKSPSVIFSQSSELLERQSSIASSTEEVSVAINDASGASRLDDGSASDAHFRVFRDFDFLEYELESVEGESSDNFNWGVRRRPLSELGTEPETEGETETEGVGTRRSRSRSQTSSDLTTVVNNSQGHFSGLRPHEIELREGQMQEESSDEEDLGLSPMDEHGPSIQGRNSDPPTPQPNSLTMIELGSSQVSSPARSRRLSDTSLDSRSEEETTPCNLSPQGGLLIEEEEEELGEEEEVDGEGDGDGDDTDANITSEILNETGDMMNGGASSANRDAQSRIIEDFQDWKSILQRFLVGIRPLQSLESIQTMSQMVQTSFCEVIYVCQDISALLTSLGFESSTQIAQNLSVLLDFSSEHNLHMAAWHLWCAKDVIRGDEVKIFLLEASEHLETLNDRKESLQDVVEGGLKPLVKLKALEGELPTYEESQSASFAEAASADPFEIIADVSKLLYRTLFQLRLLLECHQRAVQSLSSNPKSKIRDLSRQVLEVRAALLQCISTLVIQGDKGSKLTLSEAEGCLLDLLLANQWENAIELFKANRDIWPKDLIGNSSNDVTGILNVYCKYLSEEHSGVFVSIPNDFRNLCSQVNSVCLHLLENQQSLEKKTLV